jgi:hypothetical protein
LCSLNPFFAVERGNANIRERFISLQPGFGKEKKGKEREGKGESMFFSSLLFSITHPSITLYEIDTFRVPRTTQDAWPIKSKGTDACTTMSFEGAGAREVDRPVSVSAYVLGSDFVSYALSAFRTNSITSF